MDRDEIMELEIENLSQELKSCDVQIGDLIVLTNHPAFVYYDTIEPVNHDMPLWHDLLARLVPGGILIGFMRRAIHIDRQAYRAGSVNRSVCEERQRQRSTMTIRERVEHCPVLLSRRQIASIDVNDTQIRIATLQGGFVFGGKHLLVYGPQLDQWLSRENPRGGFLEQASGSP